MRAPDAATLLVDEIDHLDETTRASLLARPRGTRMIVAGIEDPDPTDDTVWVLLTPLEPHEVGPYVQHRLHNAAWPPICSTTTRSRGSAPRRPACRACSTRWPDAHCSQPSSTKPTA